MGLTVGMVFRVTRVPEEDRNNTPWNKPQSNWPTIEVKEVHTDHIWIQWSDMTFSEPDSKEDWEEMVNYYGLEPVLTPVEEDLLWD